MYFTVIFTEQCIIYTIKFGIFHLKFLNNQPKVRYFSTQRSLFLERSTVFFSFVRNLLRYSKVFTEQYGVLYDIVVCFY